MQSLQEALQEYLNSWFECSGCNHMIKQETLLRYNDNIKRVVEGYCDECMNKITY